MIGEENGHVGFWDYHTKARSIVLFFILIKNVDVSHHRYVPCFSLHILTQFIPAEKSGFA